MTMTTTVTCSFPGCRATRPTPGPGEIPPWCYILFAGGRPLPAGYYCEQHVEAAKAFMTAQPTKAVPADWRDRPVTRGIMATLIWLACVAAIAAAIAGAWLLFGLASYGVGLVIGFNRVLPVMRLLSKLNSVTDGLITFAIPAVVLGLIMSMVWYGWLLWRRVAAWLRWLSAPTSSPPCKVPLPPTEAPTPLPPRPAHAVVEQRGPEADTDDAVIGAIMGGSRTTVTACNDESSQPSSPRTNLGSSCYTPAAQVTPPKQGRRRFPAWAVWGTVVGIIGVAVAIVALIAVYADRCHYTGRYTATVCAAVAAEKRGDYGTVLRLMLPLAEKGMAEAQATVATLYASGRGTPQNDDEAARWFRQAAEQGYAEGQSMLGALYYLGQGVPKDDVEAYAWLDRAASDGHTAAAKRRDMLATLMTAEQALADRGYGLSGPLPYGGAAQPKRRHCPGPDLFAMARYTARTSSGREQ